MTFISDFRRAHMRFCSREGRKLEVLVQEDLFAGFRCLN